MTRTSQISNPNPHAIPTYAGGAGGGCPCKEQSDQDFTDADLEDREVFVTTEGRVADKARYPALDDATTEPIFPPELALAAPRALHLRSAKVGYLCGCIVAVCLAKRVNLYESITTRSPTHQAKTPPYPTPQTNQPNPNTHRRRGTARPLWRSSWSSRRASRRGGSWRGTRRWASRPSSSTSRCR